MRGYTRGHGVQHHHSIDTLRDGPVAPQEAPASLIWQTEDGAVYVPLMVRERVTVAKLWVACDTSATGNVDLGLYDAGGARLVSSGSTAHPAAATELVVDVTDTVIDAGIYYFACTSDSGLGDDFFQLPTTSTVSRALGVYTQTTAFPLPSSATFALPTTSYVIVGGLLLNTVAS